MSWQLTISAPGFNGDEPVTMTSESMTAQEDEVAYLVGASSIPHDGEAIRPLHCPGCRNGLAVAALVCRSDSHPADDAAGKILAATIAVAVMPRDVLLACFSAADTTTEPDPVE